MPDGFDIDFSDISKLAADLGEVPDNAGRNIRKAVEVSARNVKDSWRDKLEGARALPGAARSINYDIESDGHSVEAEIGADIGGQGSLVGIVEYGSPTLAPRGYGLASLQENEADFERGLSKALGQAEREAGL